MATNSNFAGEKHKLQDPKHSSHHRTPKRTIPEHHAAKECFQTAPTTGPPVLTQDIVKNQATSTENTAGEKHKLHDPEHSSHHRTPTRKISEHHAAKERFPGLNAAINSVQNKDIHSMTCSYCSQAGAKKHCIPCKSDDSKRVIYCSVNCQKQHWKEHKKICVSIAQNKEVSNKRTNEPTMESIARKDDSNKISNNYKDADVKQCVSKPAANPPQAQWTKSPPTPRNGASAQVTEYVVKFSFKSRHTKQDTRHHIARCHHECLQAMASVSTQALDINGTPMPRSSSPPSMSEFEQHFKLYFSPGNKFKNHRPLYTIYHRIRSTMSLGTLCKQPQVSTVLNKNNVSINLHIWKEDEVDIVNLGFHIGADPCNQLKTHFEADIRSYITAMTGTLPDKIPYFQSGFSRPFHNNETGRSVTQSYNLQCRRVDANDLIRLLQATFHNDHLMFAFHKLRHDNPAAYKEAIDTQNEFLTNRRAIPIHGITEELMSSIEDDLYELDGIHSIQRHKYTTTTGRWNVMTNIDHFRSLIPQIKQLLPKLALIYGDESMQDSYFPPIGLAFNKQARKMVLKPNQPTFAAVSKGLKTQEHLPRSRPTSPDKLQQTLPAPIPWTTPSTHLPNSISSITRVRSLSQDDQSSPSDSNSLQNTSITSPKVTFPKNSKQSANNSVSNTIPTCASSVISDSAPTQVELTQALQLQTHLKEQIATLTKQMDLHQQQFTPPTSCTSREKSNKNPVDSVSQIPPNSASSVTTVRDPDQANIIFKAAPASHSMLKSHTITTFKDASGDPLKHSPVDSASNAAPNSASSATSDRAPSQADLETAQQLRTQLKITIANMTQQMDFFRQQHNTSLMSVPTEIEIRHIVTQVVQSLYPHSSDVTKIQTIHNNSNIDVYPP
jgi:hypothetical protein